MNGITVLSLFDGMSCGRLALERAGIEVKEYYASEIDKHAIKVTMKNYPDTIQIGDVTKVNGHDLPKIDLLIGGSPCQGFSFAGKGLQFDDPRSKLFFEYARIKEECRPAHYMLENVIMDKRSEDVISLSLGVRPIMINSALVSAQNRERLYWCNFPVYMPNDKKIMLSDIISNDAAIDRDKSHSINGSIGRTTEREYYKKNQGQLVYKNSAFGVHTVGTFSEKYINIMDKGYCLTSEIPVIVDTSLHGESLLRMYTDKSPTLKTGNFDSVLRLLIKNGAINTKNIKEFTRKLTPIECERLQTVPDNYTDCVSNSQRYKMLGNGWTVDVIAHIFKHLPYSKYGIENKHVSIFDYGGKK